MDYFYIFVKLITLALFLVVIPPSQVLALFRAVPGELAIPASLEVFVSWAVKAPVAPSQCPVLFQDDSKGFAAHELVSDLVTHLGRIRLDVGGSG